MSGSEPDELNRLRLVFDQSPVFMALLEGPEHRFVLINNAYQQLIGPRDVLGLTVQEALPEIIGQGFIELLDEVLRSGRPFVGRDVETSLQRRADSQPEIRRLDFVYQPIRDQDGRVNCILVQGVDETAANHAADTLRADRRRLEDANADLMQRALDRSLAPGTTWEVSPHLLSVIDMADGRFLRVNPAWPSRLGWSEDEIVGRPYIEFLHPEDLPSSLVAFNEVKQGLPVLNFENRYRAKDGRYEWLSWVAVPEFGKLYSTTRIVTAEKDQALALTKAEDALRQSQKMEAVGQLTGGIAHDFNNMLAVIIGGLNLIERRQPAGAATADLMAAVQEGAQRAAELVRRLMAFSRQLPLKPENVDVAEMVKTMSSILRRTLGEQIILETVLAGGLWKARTDVNQLESAILNIALNARDAMPDGGKLTIETSNTHLDDEYARAHAEVAAGQYVLVAISDTGTGMPPDVADKAFEPFFTTKGVGKGTGLGLSQVFGYVKQSRGHIKIYSEIGQGTAIKIYLPRSHQQDVRTKAVAAKSPARLGSINETILVVEDDSRMRAVTAAGLKELGYTVLVAASGTEALDAVRDHPEVCLLFTDVVMPGMSGRRLADETRKLRPEIRVLFATGYTRNAIVHNDVLDADVHLLSKPFTLDQMAEKVREALS